MTGERKEEVEDRARQVFKAAGDYHFAYEVLASLKIIHDEFEKHEADKGTFGLLRNELLKAKEIEDPDQRKSKVDELLMTIRHMKLPFGIRVEYDENLDEDQGWVFYLRELNQFVILIPEKLKITRTDDGIPNDKEKDDKLRSTTAHEVGHIALHAEALIAAGGKGSQTFDPEKEDEADAFSDELIKLRAKRDHNEALLGNRDGVGEPV